ncbi:serine/arginine repetitive matrix protein 4-like isoform X1 [Syngnathoides biaculeatus]|uniref:serine/arginine repetitive matrix protein 4-like isoform X1 n=1 Tax=Syngnathoides biaculeatus TaxID=300417 RepID=UPI002ADE15E7|nr:serine/arginine repetitive matrix protein 4-like isoform X1 [Syngnathoides biaculeatus]
MADFLYLFRRFGLPGSQDCGAPPAPLPSIVHVPYFGQTPRCRPIADGDVPSEKRVKSLLAHPFESGEHQVQKRSPEAKADRTPGDRRRRETTADPEPRDDGNTRKWAAADSAAPPIGRKKHKRRHRRRRRRRAESASFDEELSPRLEAKKKKKKKKRKSERKTSRRRVPSSSLSPPRKKKMKKGKKKKKKKKKKKSSKKNKRHRFASKKSKHGSSGFKRGKKEQRKGKERQTAYKKETRPTSEAKWTRGGGAAKSLKTPSVLRGASMFSREIFRGRSSRRTERSHDCDSGNDTSSPPSGESSAGDGPRPPADGASDSGNSLTSYASGGEDDSSAGALHKREHQTLGYRFNPARSPRTSSRGRRSDERRRRRERSRSSGSSRYPSSSPSTASSYSRSPSFSTDLRRRWGSLSSVSSRGSYSTYRRRSRLRSRERASSSRETQERKVGRKRWRRESYSPVRKRRRCSPSHLEARRITSARKRPVPYLRRSSSSRSSTRGSFGAARRGVSRY